MQIRISVDDATLAPELVRRLEGLFDSPSVSFDPAHNEVWDLRLANGSPAAPGVYVVVLRAGDRSRILRTAVVR